MKVTKHGNKYRIQIMVDGKRHNISFDHHPNQIEISRAVAEVTSQYKTDVNNCTFRQACDIYLTTKSNVLSPATVRGYRSLVKIIPDDFMEKRVLSITNINVQTLVNDYAVDHSPKTVSNYAHFVTCVLSYHGIDIKPPQLPQREKKSTYIPSVDDIQKILEQIQDTKYMIPITLLLFGLRRSELCALDISDLHGNELTINKALVQDDKMEWKEKTTKTTASTRTIIIPDDLADKIREQGYIYKGHPCMLYRTLHNAQQAASIPPFPLHNLRHFFASYLHARGFSNKVVQDMGGWATTSTVLQTVYQHAMDVEQNKTKMADDIGSIIKPKE